MQEDERVERLVLRRGRHVPLHGEVRQERGDLRRAHLVRVLDAVEADVANDPVDVG